MCARAHLAQSRVGTTRVSFRVSRGRGEAPAGRHVTRVGHRGPGMSKFRPLQPTSGQSRRSAAQNSGRLWTPTIDDLVHSCRLADVVIPRRTEVRAVRT